MHKKQLLLVLPQLMVMMMMSIILSLQPSFALLGLCNDLCSLVMWLSTVVMITSGSFYLKVPKTKGHNSVSV
jgi:hypothetical protein